MSTRWFDPWAELARIRTAIPAKAEIAARDQPFAHLQALRNPAIEMPLETPAIASDRKCREGLTCWDNAEIATFADFAADACSQIIEIYGVSAMVGFPSGARQHYLRGTSPKKNAIPCWIWANDALAHSHDVDLTGRPN